MGVSVSRASASESHQEVGFQVDADSTSRNQPSCHWRTASGSLSDQLDNASAGKSENTQLQVEDSNLELQLELEITPSRTQMREQYNVAVVLP